MVASLTNECGSVESFMNMKSNMTKKKKKEMVVEKIRRKFKKECLLICT